VTPARQIPRCVIEPLGEHHARTGFTCGVPELDDYFRQRIGQDVRRGVTCARVLVAAEERRMVLGFYTLSSTVIPLKDLPPQIAKRLPRYPNIPATLLGRLAVSLSHRRRGLGEFLLMDALAVSWRQSRTVASSAVVAEAKDEAARVFYARYGFIRFPESTNRLFLPMKTIERLVPPARLR
jgi:predicted GNAT family N-acyltransferase